MYCNTPLIDVGIYNAVTIDPFQGVCGLSLYKNHVNNQQEIRRYLTDCNNFCEVFRNLDDIRKALEIDIILYRGLIKFFDTGEKREKWNKKIDFVSKTIKAILDNLSKNQEVNPVDIKDVEECIRILLEFRRVAEDKLLKPEEKFIYR